MSLHRADWLKLLGGAALAATGIGLAGAGPLAGILGGAGSAGAGTGAGIAGAAGTSAGSSGLLGSMSPEIGKLLLGQAVGLGASGAQPKYDTTAPGAAPQGGAMDLNALLAKPQQQPSRLPQLQLGLNRRY